MLGTGGAPADPAPGGASRAGCPDVAGPGRDRVRELTPNPIAARIPAMTRARHPPLPDPDEVLRAVRSLVPATPLVEVPELSRRMGIPIHLKLENLQITGSFKVRGATARILDLEDDERRAGVVACSSGNHGRAVAWVAERLGIPATLCVPAWVDPVKLRAMRRLGARVIVAGDTYDAAATRARAVSAERGATLVHPFDDPVVAAGQGTVASEILQVLPEVGTVVVPLSGGGLVGGMASVLRARRGGGGGHVRVVAASARRARVMYESLRAGAPVELPEEHTVASALSGGIELDNRTTFQLVRDLVDEHVLVDEGGIVRAMAYAVRALHVVVEGGGAVGLAALRGGLVRPPEGRPLVVVLSGGNVSDRTLRRVLEEHPPEDGPGVG